MRISGKSGIGLFSLCVAVVAACFAICDDRRPSDEQVLREVLLDTGLVIPSEAKVSAFEVAKSFMDPAWLAKISLPTSQCDALRVQLESWPSAVGMFFGAYSDGVEWWKPTNVVADKHYGTKRNTLAHVVLSKEHGQCLVFIEHVATNP